MFTVYLILLKQKCSVVGLRVLSPGWWWEGPRPLSPDIKEEWRQNMQNNAITGSWTLGTQPRDKPPPLPRMLQGQKVTPASRDFPGTSCIIEVLLLGN